MIIVEYSKTLFLPYEVGGEVFSFNYKPIDHRSPRTNYPPLYGRVLSVSDINLSMNFPERVEEIYKSISETESFDTFIKGFMKMNGNERMIVHLDERKIV